MFVSKQREIFKTVLTTRDSSQHFQVWNFKRLTVNITKWPIYIYIYICLLLFSVVQIRIWLKNDKRVDKIELEATNYSKQTHIQCTVIMALGYFNW